MPLILPGNVASALPTGYSVANSCRFNKGDTAYMHKTTSAGNRKTWTYSTWFKRISLGTQVTFGLVQANTANDNIMAVQLVAANTMDIWDYNGGMSAQITTNRVFRDVGSWYHVVLAVDTTDSTANNRMRLYINGVEERGAGGYSTDTMPAEDYTFNINVADKALKLGVYDYGSVSSPADFYLAETVFIDGTQYAASDFGEFDEDSPTIWKPKDVSGLTFGTNGFYLDYEDSANLGNDANGGTDLTEVNLAATDQSADTPTLNYPTWNSNTLLGGAVAVYSEGNLKSVQPSGGASKSISNIGVSTGKWYIEVKQTAVSNPLGNGEQLIGVISDSFTYNTSALDNAMNYSYVLRNYNGTKSENGSSGTGWHGDWTAGDIIGIGLDMDNHRVYFSKGGQWSDGSGNWDESSPSGYLTLSSVPTFYFVCAGTQHSTAGATYEINSGSPSYANSSDAADANGYGAFEFAPPSGYLAINSANLGSDGG